MIPLAEPLAVNWKFWVVKVQSGSIRSGTMLESRPLQMTPTWPVKPLTEVTVKWLTAVPMSEMLTLVAVILIPGVVDARLSALARQRQKAAESSKNSNSRSGFTITRFRLYGWMD